MLTPDQFRRACAQFATGITVMTASQDDGHPHGMTANSFTSVSLEPPLVLFCMDFRCSLLPLFQVGRWFGVNVLEQSQRELSVRFAQRQTDRFEGVDWYRGRHLMPLLRGALSTLECEIIQVTEAGDHSVILGRVETAETNPGYPLLYFDSQYRTLT